MPNETRAPASFGADAEPVEILLVDDREDNILTLEAVLAQPGYRFTSARSGEAALRFLLDHNPALILMDVQMPGLDGFATAALIRKNERTRHIPIIFLTALHQDEAFQARGYEHGAVDYLNKPYDPQILRAKVAVFAELHRKNLRLLEAERLLLERERGERDRRIAELEIRGLRREQQEQKRYRDLVEGMEHGIVWSATPDLQAATFVSPAAEKILGFSQQDWLTSPSFWLQHLHPADTELFRQRLAQARESGAQVSLEHRFFSAAGSEVWLHTGFRFVPAGEGASAELRGLSVDITKAKSAERMLVKSKARSDLVAEVSLLLGTAIAEKGSHARVAELIASRFCDWCTLLVKGENGDPEHRASALRAAGPEGTAREISEHPAPPTRELETGFFGPLGAAGLAEVAASESAAALLSRHGIQYLLTLPLTARGVRTGTMKLGWRNDPALEATDLSLAEDLAYRISTAEENHSLLQAAQKAILVRDEFLSIASHELKTPLTPLKIQVQQLSRLLQKSTLHTVDPARLDRMLEISNRQVERLSRLIDDLLDISRISSGKLSLSLESFDLGELLHDLTGRFANQIVAAGCELRIDVPTPFPVHWDLLRIEQVLVNLLSNATKYGAGKPVLIRVARQGDKARIEFFDGGIGVAPADHQRIFERFERAVSGTHFGGLGLGLYITRQIVEAHQGRIFVESRAGEGSCFIVEVPLNLRAEAAPDTEISPPSLAPPVNSSLAFPSMLQPAPAEKGLR